MSQFATGLPVLAVCGFSGSGKTTVLEAIIPLLRERGLSVAVVKHDAHGVELDRPGKDSDRLFAAGADVLLRGPNESAARWHPDAAPDLETALAELCACHDLVLIEGHKSTPVDKLWLLREGETEPPSGVVAIRRALPWNGKRTTAAIEEITEHLDRVWRERQVNTGVMIGGTSSRMGTPKQLLELEGRTLVERVAGVLQSAAGPPLLLGAGPVPEALGDLSRLPDPPGISGPMAGLVAALRWHPRVAWLIAACDQPMVSPDAVDWLLAQRGPGRWAVLPRLPDGPVEPFLAVYEPQALGLLERAIASGRLGPHVLAEHAKVVSPEPPAEIAQAWRSLNTPEEFEASESS
jgi:molybdopterin-guanine dinucleotide biosynthesis protein MobB